MTVEDATTLETLKYSGQVELTVYIEVREPEAIPEVLALVRSTITQARTMGAASATVRLSGRLEGIA